MTVKLQGDWLNVPRSLINVVLWEPQAILLAGMTVEDLLMKYVVEYVSGIPVWKRYRVELFVA
jgi:hypothetical protein